MPAIYSCSFLEGGVQPPAQLGQSPATLTGYDQISNKMAEIVRACAVVVAILMRMKQKMAEKIEMVGISVAVLG